MITKINSRENIIKYIERSKIRLYNKHLPADNIHNYSAKKLEGIQQGIPLFENLSMAQIMQIIKDKIESQDKILVINSNKDSSTKKNLGKN